MPIRKLKIQAWTVVSYLSRSRQQALSMPDTATGEMIRDLL
jgi:hypothetical protein